MKSQSRIVQPSWIVHLTLLTLFCFLITAFPSSATAQKKTNPPTGTILSKNLVYREIEGLELKLDVYRPIQKSDTPLPVVLWIHGGGWLKGSKENCKAAYLAQHDFAVVSVGYRLTDVAQWPAQIEDCYAAVRWIRENAETYDFDPERIGAWGGSAGGHLAAILGTRQAGKEKVSSRVQAVCDWYGPTDLLTMPPNVVSEKRTREQVEKSNGAKLLGAPVPDIPEKAKDASALYHVSKEDPPFLIMHGSADPGVPVIQSQRFHEALEKAGVDSELILLEGAGHGGKDFQTQKVKDTVRRFFEEKL